jgi:hypothetical protein
MNGNRKHERYDFDRRVQLVFENGVAHQGRSLNFSMGGMFIEIDPLPDFGSKVTLVIDLPNVPETCNIPCIVRWTKHGSGAGVQFETVRPIEVWSLSNLVRKLKGDG